MKELRRAAAKQKHRTFSESTVKKLAVTTITLPYPPSANRYWRIFRGHVAKSAEARRYQERVGWELKAAGCKSIDGEVSITILLYRPRKSGDLDNRLKVVLDALQGYAYGNDSQIAEIHAYRGDDKENPRVEICIAAAWRQEGRIE